MRYKIYIKVFFLDLYGLISSVRIFLYFKLMNVIANTRLNIVNLYYIVTIIRLFF